MTDVTDAMDASAEPDAADAAGPAAAAEGTPLMLARIAQDLRLSLTQLAAGARISRSAVHSICKYGVWPRRTPKTPLQAAITKVFVDAGATPEQLEQLFQPVPPLPPRKFRARNFFGTLQLDLAASGGRDPLPDEEESPDMLLAKQSLTPKARSAFRLGVNPFDGDVSDDMQIFTSSEIAYVREACMQAAIGGRFVGVVGESGAGKTTILRNLEARIAREGKQVIVIKPWVTGMEDNDSVGKTLKSTDILAAIVSALDPLAKIRQTLQARNSEAKTLLANSARAGYSHLLVIEEAHSMPDVTLNHLKRLHEMREDGRALFGILLLGQTELALKLHPRRANLREVSQRIELVQLLPLDGDLHAYLTHRLKSIGRSLDEFIDAGGIEALKTRLTLTRSGAGGKTRATSLLYPLAVNNLLTAALNEAAEINAPIVNRDVVLGIGTT